MTSSDWSKWLITIETAAIAIIGGYFTSGARVEISLMAKVFGICSVICFVLSILAAAMLLWTLPEIAQNLRPDVNIWMKQDSIARKLFRMNTQGFAIVETLAFILGIILFTALILTVILQN